MKLSCNVAQDLLPLYHDGVCSDESRTLVEAHLEGCERCRSLLRELRGELALPHEEPDDLSTMKKLGAQVRKGNKRAWLKGAAAVLAVVLVLGAALVGLNDYENRKYQAQVARFVQGHEDAAIADADYPYDYDWVHGNYLFRVDVPEPGYRGEVEVREFKWTKDLAAPADLIQVSLNVQQFHDDGEYLYLITIENGAEGADWVWQTVTLDQNGQTVHDEGWDEETIARKDELIVTYRTEIRNIIAAAEREWPFLMGEG